MQRYLFIKEALNPLCLVAAQVALWPLGPHDFTATGNVETTFCSFMSFEFRHFEIPLALLSL